MPRRPPKKWFYRTVAALERKGGITDPAAVAAWQWFHGLDAQQRKTILKKEERLSGMVSEYYLNRYYSLLNRFPNIVSRGKSHAGERLELIYNGKIIFRGDIYDAINFLESQQQTGGIIMAGLPAKYAKMGFKRGWRAYHAAHRLGEPGRGGRGKKVHHALWLDGVFSAPALVQRPLKSMKSITPGKILSPVIDLGLLIAGMALGAGIKKVSPIKNPHLMNGAQVVIGVGGSLLTKNRFVKMPLLGIALQSTVSEVKILIPNMIPLAGDDEVVYLPVQEEVPQLVHGEDDRVSGVIDGEDERVSGVVDVGGEDGEFSGEGTND